MTEGITALDPLQIDTHQILHLSIVEGLSVTSVTVMERKLEQPRK